MSAIPYREAAQRAPEPRESPWPARLGMLKRLGLALSVIAGYAVSPIWILLLGPLSVLVYLFGYLGVGLMLCLLKSTDAEPLKEWSWAATLLTAAWWPLVLPFKGIVRLGHWIVEGY